MLPGPARRPRPTADRVLLTRLRTTPGSDPVNEERCARLIAMASHLGPLGGCVVVDDGYEDDEIRVANETARRASDGKVGVVRGRITMTPTSQFRTHHAIVARLDPDGRLR